MIFLSYLKMFLISLATGWGLGLGFWSAHLLCKWLNKKLEENQGGRCVKSTPTDSSIKSSILSVKDAGRLKV